MKNWIILWTTIYILAQSFVTGRVLGKLSDSLPDTFPGKLIFSGSNQIEKYLETFQLTSCTLEYREFDDRVYHNTDSQFILLSRNAKNVEFLQYTALIQETYTNVVFSRIFIYE